MKEYTTESIRNIALVSHSSAGKTMLAEAFLHFSGATTRLGKIEDGTTVSDFEEEEIRRRISLSTSVLPVEYKGCKLNVLDTPGYTDFIGEVISALRVADSAAVLVDSVAGAEVGTEVALSYIDTFKLPWLVVINKMNRDNANFRKALESIQEISDKRLIPVQLPWGEKADFKGVIDLLTLKAYPGVGDTAQDIPAEYQDEVENARMQLIEEADEVRMPCSKNTWKEKSYPPKRSCVGSRKWCSPATGYQCSLLPDRLRLVLHHCWMPS